MSDVKFKVGDRVTAVCGGILNGKSGVIITIPILPYYVSTLMCGVDFGIICHGTTHTLNSSIPSATGRWMYFDELEKMESELVVELL